MTFKSLNLSGLITAVVFRARHETTFPIMLPSATVAAHWFIEKARRRVLISCSAVRSSALNNDCARGWCETGEMRDLTPILYIALFHTFFSKQTQWICGFLQNTRNTESVSLPFNSSRDSERLLLLNQCIAHTVCLFVFVSDMESACFVDCFHLYMFGKETSVSLLSLSDWVYVVLRSVLLSGN